MAQRVGQSVEALLGRSEPLQQTGLVEPQAAIGKNDFDFFVRDLAEEYRRDDLRVMESGRPLMDKIEPVSRDGTSISWVSVSKAPIRDTDGKVIGMVGIARDITTRREAEQVLRESEAYLRSLIDNFPYLVWLKDTAGRFLAVNQPFADACGLGDPRLVEGKTDLDVWPRDLAEKYRGDDRAVLARGEKRHVEELISDKGRAKWFETFKSPIRGRDRRILGTAGFSRDITDRKQAEAELQRAAKLESIGILAGGIAHDFNNLLAAISGNAGLAQSLLKSGEGAAAEIHLAEAENAAMRARGLTQQLLTFARGGEPQKAVISVERVILEAATFALVGSRNRARYVFHSTWPIEADPSQIHQVIHNLVLNADQAMPSPGEILVQADNAVLGEDNRLSLAAGAFVKLTVEDRGVGIPAEIIEKVFDPFFTTKQRGSGLGLSSAYAIVKAHGGRIAVESQPGRGSVFTVYLPASPEKRVQEEPQLAAAPEIGPLRILVLEDEGAIRTFLQSSLGRRGHEVVTVADGESAIRLFKDSGIRFDVVILDLTVPGSLGGEDVMRELRRLDPEVTAIASSGYATDPIMANFQEHGFAGRLAKPYRLAELEQVLAEVVSGRGGKPAPPK